MLPFLMRGEYAKKEYIKKYGRTDWKVLCVCDDSMVLVFSKRTALMFSVDENFSSFCSFLHCCHSRLERGIFLSMIWKGKNYK